MTAPLWEYTASMIRDGLQRIAEAPDVYVVTVFVWTAPSTDPRWSTIELQWDTEERYAARTKRASEEDLPALRWGIEYLAPGDRELWDPDDDPDGHDALELWARERGLWFEGERDNVDDALIDRGLELARQIVDGLVATVRELHADGTVRSTFGRAIPVTLVSHASHSRYPEWSRLANPPELYEQFGPYYESIWSPG